MQTVVHLVTPSYLYDTEIASRPRFAIHLELDYVGMLGEEDARLALVMVDDRNLTVHAYNDAVAEAISQRLAGYART